MIDNLTQECGLEASQSPILGDSAYGDNALDWRSSSTANELSTHDVHFWRGWIDRPNLNLEQALELLSNDERARLERFTFEKDRRRFAFKRGLLRLILARYMDVPPAYLQFNYGRFGKPALAHLRGGDIQFNLSHSDGLVLVAITKAIPVGVDIERIRAVPEAGRIFSQISSAEESRSWHNLDPIDQPKAFVDCWTSKEACSKATGFGLQAMIKTAAVFSANGTLIRSELPNPYRTDIHLVRNFTPAPDYTASVAFTR